MGDVPQPQRAVNGVQQVWNNKTKSHEQHDGKQPGPLRNWVHPMPVEEWADALHLMNTKRWEVGSYNMLRWDNDLAASAQEWANQLAAEGGGIHHATQKVEGECITGPWQQGQNPPVSQSVQLWLDEQPNYDGSKIGQGPGWANFMNWGHFTQCVWDKSTRVGLAKAQTSDGDKSYVVGRFLVHGNMMGEYPNNRFAGEMGESNPSNRAAGPNPTAIQPLAAKPQPVVNVNYPGWESEVTSVTNADGSVTTTYGWKWVGTD